MIDLNKKRIVVTFLMHLGDLVLTTPFLYLLRQAAPDSHITYVVDKKLADVVSCNPYIDEVICIDKKGKDNNIFALRRIAKEIAATRPDIVINLHPNERTSFLAWMIDAPTFVGVSHAIFRRALDCYTPLKRDSMHAADMYVDVLTQLGIPKTKNQGLQIFLDPRWEETVRSFYEEAEVTTDDKIIGFNIGSAVPEKRWPAERFAFVADYFAEKGYKIIFFGGSMDRDMVEEAVQHMKSVPIIGTGKFSIGELAAAMKRCSLLITNDSGPMHVGVSQGIPLVTLYGPSNPAFYGPYTDNAIVLESTQDRVIGKEMNKIIKAKEYVDISIITVTDVITASETLLAQESAGER